MTDHLKKGNMHSDAWCPIPFNAVSLHPTGTLTRCMMSEEYMTNREDLDWDNPDFQKLRKDMLRGEWDEEGCVNCKMKEESGVRSQRQNWLHGDARKNFPADAWDEPKITGNPIRHLFLNFNNVCNFKCRMCSPRYSNSLIPEHRWLRENDFPWHKHEPENHKNINNVEAFLLANKHRLKDVVSIWVTGGEPFMGDSIWRTLDLLEEYADPSKIRISVTTNGSKVTIEQLERFKIFKKLNFDLSMDAVGDLFEYMRSDGVFSWNDFNSFVEQLSAYAKINAKWMHVSVNSSFQVYNANNLYEFYEYAHKHFGKGHVNMRVLVGPQHFQARNSPKEFKATAKENILRLLENKEIIYYDEDARVINDCLTMLERPPVAEMVDRLERYTEAQDRYRKRYVADYLPLLAEGLVDNGN
jgi:MoaA/NifB/PqqE/SkfB family radical SAM enzyme